MRDKNSVDIDSLPVAFGEIKITKDKVQQLYNFEVVTSNKRFRLLLSDETFDTDFEFIINKGLELELFSQKALKSYYHLLLNHSFKEFLHTSISLNKRISVGLNPTKNNLLGITLITLPNEANKTSHEESFVNFAKVLDNSFDLILVLDKELRIKFCNQIANNVLGIINKTEEQIEAISLVHPEDKQIFLNMIERLIQRPSIEIKAEVRILNKDQNYITTLLLAKNMFNVDCIGGFVINAKDLTNEEVSERKLIENQLYLESLFDAIPNLIFVLDYEGKFLDFKSYNNSRLAFSPDQFLGKNISTLFPEYLSKKVISSLQQLRICKEALPISYQYKHRSPEIGHYECHLSIIDDEKVLAIVNDVTALKNAEEKLTKSQTLIQRKLDAIVSPEGHISDLELSDLVNIDELKDLFKTINEFTNVPITLLDKKGNIIFTIGMSKLCKEFHLFKCKPLAQCQRSNYSNTQSLKFGESKLYKCLNNIWNLVCPVYVGGDQIASLDICQFRLADDENNYDEILREQAKNYNFETEAYLKAYYSLPKLDKEHLIKISSYYRDILSKITALSYAQIKQARTANKLTLREKELTQITDNMTDVIYIIDLQLNVTYVSPSVEKIFGFTPEEYKKQSMQKKLPQSSIDIINKSFEASLSVPFKDNSPVMVEYQEYDINGKLIDISFHVKFLRDDNMQPIGIIGSARDVSDKKRAETNLNAQLELQSLLSSMAMRYINIPINQIEDSISDSLEKIAQFAHADRAFIFKYDWENKTSIYTNEWCNTDIDTQTEKYQTMPFDTMKSWNEEHFAGRTIIINNSNELPNDDDRKQLLMKQGVKSFISVPLMSGDVCLGFVGFDSVKAFHHFSENEITMLKIFAHLLVNIENRISMAKELGSQREKATQSDKLKSTLLKNISHEFRTPLNGIIGISELLKNKPIDSEYQQLANMILSSGIRLLNVLDSIMLLSQLESINGSKSLNLEKTDISNLLMTLTEQFRKQINQKGLDLILDIKANLSVSIDNNLFRQAFTHIVNNAIKYTQEGSIKVSCSLSRDDMNVVINIQDTGIGIPTESQDIIFSDFRQVSEGYNRAYEGCGLGLPIAKRAIELMLGEIYLESEMKKGSKVTIILPCVTNNLKKPKVLNSETRKSNELTSSEEIISTFTEKPLILIVEDNKVNQKLASSILRNFYETDSAFDGETAIRMTTQKQYEAILMDIHLGEGLDGLEVTKIIRSDIRYKNTPIIAVTGYTMLGDREHILKQGCSHYLGKPYNKSQLLDILNIALQKV